MTNRQIIQSLIQRGIKVSYYVRLDGSIRVTELQGVKYSPRLSKGNEAARVLYFALQGSDQEQAKAKAYEALKPIRAQRAAAQASRASGRTLKSQPKFIQDEFRKLQDRVRRMSKANIKEGKRGFEGISWTKTRTAAGYLGISPEAQIMRMMDYYEPLASDVAPRVMVQGLIDKIYMIEPKYPYLSELREYLENNIAVQDVYTLDKAGNVVYEINATESQSPQGKAKADEILEELKARAHTSKR